MVEFFLTLQWVASREKLLDGAMECGLQQRRENSSWVCKGQQALSPKINVTPL